MKNTTSAALICRVSTREQEEGYSLEAQERLLKEYCEKEHLQRVLTLSFSETASKYAQRKKFREFAREVETSGICHIVAEKVDRVSRSGSRDGALIDTWLEDDQDRHLHLVKQSLNVHKYAPSSVKFVWAMHLAVAKHMSDNLSEEIRKTADVMLRNGIWPTKALPGYRRDKTNQACPVQPDPKTAPLATRMFELYDTGDWSVKRLSFKMEEIGLLNSNKHRIMPSRIHRLLQDPFYIGKMRYRGMVWPGAHQPLVSYDLFERVQQRLTGKSRGTGTSPYRKYAHLLTGVVVCGGCTKPLSWEIHRGHCYGYCKHYSSCQSRAMIRESAITEGILPQLDALVVQNERLADWIGRILSAAHADDAKLKVTARHELEAKIGQLTQKINRLLDLRLDGEITKDDFEQRKSRLTSDKDRLTTALSSLDTPNIQTADRVTSIYELGRSAPEQYKTLPSSERRRIIRQVFSEIAVNGRMVSMTYTGSYALLAKAVAATNGSKSARKLDFEKKDFELIKIGSDKLKRQPFGGARPSWWTAWDTFREEILKTAYGISDE